jgi:hypothetical protein
LGVEEGAAGARREEVVGLTTDPDDPRLAKSAGCDAGPVEQQAVYLVFSDEERAKGFVRPVRDTYRHVGADGPANLTRDLTDEEQVRYADVGYVSFEAYPESESAVTGRFWTQVQLDATRHRCGALTKMGQALAETYARDPYFYGATYCVGCRMHRPVGEHGEFEWLDGQKVGT